MKFIFDTRTEKITGYGRYSAEEMDMLCAEHETWLDSEVWDD